MQILVVVTAKRGENPLRRKGKVFTATFVSRESVGPKVTLTWCDRKGNRFIFLYCVDTT